jgi:transcriptional regulator with XRE-family HTH domain
MSLGDIIRRQRELSELSMRQFARMVGISNPYLSQIERGLREPSERVMSAIAESLQTSADALYEQAGIDSDDDGGESAVVEAIRADKSLTARQRQALVQVYEAFAAQNGTGRGPRRRPRS